VLLDPAAGAEGEDDLAVEPAGRAEVGVLETGRVAELGTLEPTNGGRLRSESGGGIARNSQIVLYIGRTPPYRGKKRYPRRRSIQCLPLLGP
jgi:hypothetical protein